MDDDGYIRDSTDIYIDLFNCILVNEVPLDKFIH